MFWPYETGMTTITKQSLKLKIYLKRKVSKMMVLVLGWSVYGWSFSVLFSVSYNVNIIFKAPLIEITMLSAL